MVKIAVVNDDTTVLTLMSALLEEKGWQTTVIREGSQAYATIKRAHPDLIILDIRLESPEAGWSIVELVKLDPDTRAIPVIVCSAALDELRAKEEWLGERGIATLPKPFDIDDLYN